MSVFLAALKSHFETLPAALIDAGGLGESRHGALSRVLADGLPSPRSERWKYTPLRALSTRAFVHRADTPRLHPASLPDIPGPRLVFVNGQVDATLSMLDDLPAGLSVRALSSLLNGEENDAVDFPAERFASPDDAFARLNAALAVEGAVVRVEANATIEAPLHLAFIGAPADGDIAWHGRHRIELSENAKLNVIEHHVAVGGHRHLSNHLTQLRLDHGAKLSHARIQNEHADATVMARTDAVLDAHATYRRVDLELGATLSRHELNVSMRGESARFASGGVLLADGRRHVDSQVNVEHAAGNTRSELLWRGLAIERGRAVFHGGILIRAGADGSDAALSNKNLLLSDSAEIFTQPVLEIHADEVKASHGATVGRLDPGQLFYLRARGISAMQARTMLTHAFCREALSKLQEIALIEQLSPVLENRLASLEMGSA
jgi:Fe-S cluster assembly protein SufD